MSIFGREPTVILGFVRAAILLGVSFGLDLTPEQIALLYVLVEAALTLVNRSQVSPVSENA